jgi:aminomethyltransferase
MLKLFRRFYMKTPLYEKHIWHKGVMQNYHGYTLPMYYKDVNVVKSHHYTRSYGSIFDVSHMYQFVVTGKEKDRFLEKITVSDVSNMKPGKSVYTLMTNEKGCIIDDCILTKFEDFNYCVTNGSTRKRIISHIDEHKPSGVKIAERDRALLAIQGPAISNILPYNNLKFMEGVAIGDTFSDGIATPQDWIITRSGYTGEDGFEISLPQKHALMLWDEMIFNKVLPAGLAVRNTLRLEAGLCLSGVDFDEDTSILKAGLMWTVKKRREGGFIGDTQVLSPIKSPVKRVGFVTEGNGIINCTLPLKNDKGENVGNITSAGRSYILNKGIAMGYINSDYKIGDKITCGNTILRVAKMPFVPVKYVT